MKTRAKNYLVAAALTAAAILCITTAARIEYWNHLAGDAIQRKAEQEPNSKWRTGGRYIDAYRRVESQWRTEKGLSLDTKLSPNNQEEIDAIMRKTGWSSSPHDKLGTLLKSWGLVQYPLATMLLIASLIASANRSIREDIPRWGFHLHAMIGAAALGLAVFRGYFTSLGW